MSYTRRWSKGKGNKRYATLDKWFSRFIRLRDTDHFGYGTCITCSKRYPFQKLDAGHWQSRAKMATRFDERNVHSQCVSCNRFNGGESYSHGYQIAIKYGEEVKDRIEYKSNGAYHMTDDERKHLTEYYRTKVRKLLNEKDIAFQSHYEYLSK